MCHRSYHFALFERVACTLRRETADLSALVRADELQKLGQKLYRVGVYQPAASALEEALRLIETELGSDHIRVAQTAGNLGNLYQALRQYSNAVRSLQRSVHIFETLGMESHGAELAKAHHNLAITYTGQGEHGKAREHHQRCLAIKEKVATPPGSVRPLCSPRFMPAESVRCSTPLRTLSTPGTPRLVPAERLNGSHGSYLASRTRRPSRH